MKKITFSNEFTTEKNVPNCSFVNQNVGYLLRVITTLNRVYSERPPFSGTVCPARFWSLAKIVNVTLLLYQSYVQRLKLYNPDFIYKMATDGGGGAVFSRDGDDCKPYWSPVEIPTWMQFFSLIFVRIHTNEFIQLLY